MKILTFSRSTQLAHANRISGSPAHGRTLRRAFNSLTLIALPVLLFALTLMPRPIATAQGTACDLDPTFGNGGKVTTSFPGGTDTGTDVAVQTDGKLVVGGSSGSDFALVRYNTDGTLDQTFGTGGRVNTDFPITQEGSGYTMVIQPDGKILLAGSAIDPVSMYRAFALVRYNPDGSLDTSFDGDGRAFTPLLTSFSAPKARDIALQPDGKIIVAGSNFSFNRFVTTYYALVRYNPDGSLDTTFGTGGIAGGEGRRGELEVANAVAVQTDGKIIAAGSALNRFTIIRLNADGSFDNSFRIDDRVRNVFGGVNALAIQSDGKIVAVGLSSSGFGLARFNPDGSLDNSFDSDGMVITNFGHNATAYAVVLEPDGQIVVTGTAGTIGGRNFFALARYNPDGSPDNGFDSDGKVLTDFSGDPLGVNASGVALQTDGKIVAAGYAFINGQRDFAVARYDTNGALDNSFDTDGTVTTDFPLKNETISDLLLQPDSKIIAVGGSITGPSPHQNFQLARYNPDGTLDTTFGTGGSVSTDFVNNSEDFAHAAALQTDGKIIVVGQTLLRFTGSSNIEYSVPVARYNPDGTLDTTFGAGGKVTVDFGVGTDVAYAVAVQSDGRIVLAGGDSSDTSNFLLARLNTDGSLDSGANGDSTPADSFGTGGLVSTDFNGREDSARGVAIQTDGKIVAAGLSRHNFALARYNPDGSLDAANFGTGGKVTTDFGGDNDRIEEIAIQTDGKIVAAGATGNAFPIRDFALARYNTDGSLDTENFGTGGKVTSDLGGFETATDLALDANGKIVLGGFRLTSVERFGLPPVETRVFVVARYNTDGSPDTAFCTGGRTTLQFFPIFNVETPVAVLVQPDGRIILGGGADSGSSMDFALARFGTPPPPRPVQFALAAQSVGEGAGSLSVTVTRTGDTSAAASVDYATSPDTASIGCAAVTGTASERCDFMTTLGTLSFAAGELSKTITIPLIDDGHVEGVETFQLQLSNPAGTGTTLGVQHVTTVTINDNDAAGAPNPISTASPADYPFFVRQHYLDFLSREPEPSEPWTAVLKRCSNVHTGPSANTDCDRIAVSGAFFRSPEFRVKGFYVFRFYKLAFDRLPQYAEIVADMSFVTGATEAEVYTRKAQLATAFAARPEFINAYRAKTNEEYVAVLLGRYQLASVRTPEPAVPDGATKITLSGADLVNGLDAGTLTRAQVLRAIADSDEVAVAEYNSAFVAAQYYGYLRRTPEESGYQAWLRVINEDPENVRIMVNGFMNSTEYRLRFGRP